MRRQSGFTLLEMAITLAIAGILLSGLIMTLGAQQDASREAATRRYLAQAKEALYGFAMSTGRLPCPANPAIASGAVGAGIERPPVANGCTGGAAGLRGVLPWATLGLAETDAYGARITYRVDAVFARTAPPFTPPPPAPVRTTNAHFACGGALTDPVLPPPSQTAFALCSLGSLTINTLGGAAVVASNVPAVLVSHGPNGAGAFMPSGTQSPAGGVDEAENSNTNALFRAGSRRDAGAPTGAFDDEVDWIVPSILMHRMVQAGRLP